MAVEQTDRSLRVASTTDGASAEKNWHGGAGFWHSRGTFNGATLTLQWSPDGTNWVDLGTEAAVVAAAGKIFVLAPGQIRDNLTGSGASTSVSSDFRDL